MRTLALTLILSCTLLPSPSQAETVREAHYVMGTLLEVTIEAPDRGAGQQWIRTAVALVRHLDAELSNWSATSDLARLNRAAGAGPQPVPAHLYRLLALSKELSKATAGAFDVTVGSLLGARAGLAGAREFVQSERAQDDRMRALGSNNIRLVGPGLVALEHPATRIDLGGIGKGYALDRAAEELRAAGATSGYLDFGRSSMLAFGEASEPVYLMHAAALPGTLNLHGIALSTSRSSGSDATEDGPAVDGPAVARIFDPRTASPVRADRQATVVATDATLAEAWSTALVVDPAAGMERLEHVAGVEALVFDGERELRSSRFSAMAGWIPAQP